jgi:hypothetical protein
MATLDSTEELAKENRSLHQRIAALQRTETDLLSENQSLAHKLTSVQKRHESRQKRWKEEVVKREDEFRACIKDLESRLAQKEEELSRIAISRAGETTLGDIDVTSWLVTKGNTWSEWAHEFAHPDPNRIRPDLHPLHLRELCEGVKDFVRLTDNGEFPEELLAISDGDFRPAQLLLHGMLANFIVSETLGSPFWVFDVISADALELESPSVPRLNSISPIGFRMDLAMWNFNISPPREARSPRPVPAAERLTKPRNVCKPPRLVTSSQPSSSSLGSAIGNSNQSLPSRQTMENLYQFLLDRMSYLEPVSHLSCANLSLTFQTLLVPSGEQNANSWRAYVMKTFVEGGMSTEVDNFMLTKGTRIPLAESRLKYAGQLKDRFLRGPARFLLEDQEAAGIEKLERHLVEELDAALRFSCQLWCGQDTPLIRGFRDLTGGTSNFDSNEMQAYQTQAPFHAKRVIGAVVNEQAACHGGHPVIMVLQPSVGTSTLSRTKVGAGKGPGANTRIWTKATVLVATPKVPAQESPLAQPPASLDAASDKVVVKPPIYSAASPASSILSKESVLTLPRMAFGDVSRPLLKRSATLPLPLAT